MKLSFKFFKWRIQIKTQNLGAEEKVRFLANELIKSIQDCGYSIQQSTIDKKFGTVDINIYKYGTPDEVLRIENMANKWSIEGKINFKMLEADDKSLIL